MYLVLRQKVNVSVGNPFKFFLFFYFAIFLFLKYNFFIFLDKDFNLSIMHRVLYVYVFYWKIKVTNRDHEVIKVLEFTVLCGLESAHKKFNL